MEKLTVKTISEKNYPSADKLLETELYHGKRPRTYDFLVEKLHDHPELFLGLYLEEELAGVVQGFPRHDYVLMSEIAVDIRFRGRGFGTQLIKAFEDKAKALGYKKIKLGAQDNAVNLYLKNNYIPSLFIQLMDDKADDALKKLKKNIINITKSNGMTGIEIAIDRVDMNELNSIKAKFSPESAQYLFSKTL